ncbi:MAG: PQQ-dependent sugar dehydrogenase [Balneolales bacterium]
MSFLIYILIFSLFIGCEQDNMGSPPAINGSYQTTEAFPDLSFTRPVDFQHSGDNTNRLFVVEQRGVISVFQNDATTSDKTVFLDISEQVDDEGNEEGLLGLAFHPDYETNGYFYVNYTAGNPDRSVISRFQVSPDGPEQADEASEQEILSFDQPYGNHNGGQVSFGPDGYLYIAVGDGGSGGDPENNGQDRTTLLGNILRIDVDNQEDGNNYAIPQDNPFAGNNEGYREEIYAWGLRNPWRFSFDSGNGRLWTGDVGQNAYEEINIIEKGKNYGWNIMEATHCYEPSSGCDQSGLELPIWEYDRSEGDISVTGGFVYRGPTLAELTGQYIYADYASGRIWGLDYSDLDNPVNTELLEADFQISSFGVDQDNELYICGFDGNIYKLEAVDNEQ